MNKFTKCLLTITVVSSFASIGKFVYFEHKKEQMVESVVSTVDIVSCYALLSRETGVDYSSTVDSLTRVNLSQYSDQFLNAYNKVKKESHLSFDSADCSNVLKGI